MTRWDARVLKAAKQLKEVVREERRLYGEMNSWQPNTPKHERAWHVWFEAHKALIESENVVLRHCGAVRPLDTKGE